ncbi:MAG: aminoglycoside phosphotransferase family protein [Pseudomonadales bacterium]|nr:aminoglycoside phosphotransferase family protein [Pseudomonadales bacterium]
MSKQNSHDDVQIDVPLVTRLVASQFPQWAHLQVSPVRLSGWDNRTFHLGTEMSVRLPSGKHYAKAVAKEQLWLPQLAPHLPLPIPEPLAMGDPNDDYPWQWSIYRWLEGEIATRDNIKDINNFACDLADFLLALQTIDCSGGPTRKLRGGSLELWRGQAEAALEALSEKIDIEAATGIWELALDASFEAEALWYHGDVAAGNLLVQNGVLNAVIDFGGLGVGDPACDMTIAWTLLAPSSRRAFKERMAVSDAIWNRGRGWALWKGMIVVAKIIDTNAIELASSQYAIDQLIEDFIVNG